jgi:hypothetical protein
MKQVRLPDTKVETQRVRFFGGIDLMSPALDVKPGNALDAVNYEPGHLGGYRRIDGFERFDGRPAPSSASYVYLEGSFGQVATPLVVHGATSGATGTAVLSAAGMMAVTKTSGTFQSGENLLDAAANVLGALTAAPVPRGYRDAFNDATALAAAADLYRADIGQVPGEGPVRGVWLYNGVLYAFRNLVGSTACGLYKQGASGWQAVNLGQQMQVKQPSRAVTTSSGAVNWIAHGLTAGALVQFSGTIPAGASAATSYYVVNPAANTFQVAAGPGGAAIALGDVPAGLVCAPQAIPVIDGATIVGAVSGATAIAARVAIRTGATPSFGMTATLALSNVVGTFQAGEVLKVAGTPFANVVSPNTATTLLPGGHFHFITYTFTGSVAQRRMYFCDGVNPAHEFDGATLCPIYTGMAIDAPQYICSHKLKLFLAFDSSVQHSGDGLPFQWTILSGADEFGVGDTITGFAVQPGDTLAIFARNSCYQLNGSSNNDFNLLPISPEIGAIANTVQVVGKTFGLDGRGIVVTDRTQAYGNFVQATISMAVQPLVDQMRTRVAGSLVYRNRNQYRIYGTDGSGLICTFNDDGLVGITRLQYPVNLTTFANCETPAGDSLVFFGADNGYVYQADIGSSFDGAAIEAYIRLPFNSINSPRLRKRFRKAVLDMSATGYAAISFQPEFSYGSPDIGSARTQSGGVMGNGGHWDTDNWDGFSYDAQVVSAPEFSVEGTGLNMGVLFYTRSTIDVSHTLQGLLLHFSIRRLQR